jgi:hypothetical protein
MASLSARALSWACAIALIPCVGRPQESARGPRAVTIAATGDVLTHRRVVAVARAAEGGFRAMLSALSAGLPAEDIGFVNLESPLTESVRPPANADPPVLGAPTEYGAALAATGFDVVSVANNHAFDQGGDGLAITLDAAAAAGMRAVGAGRSEAQARGPVVLERRGVRVAFLAVTERMNAGPSPNRAGVRVFMEDRDALRRALTEARTRADLVVLSAHWSHDFMAGPTPEQRARARTWVRWGADVILGTGPHVLHAVERMSSPRGEAVCAYSLGNAISNQGGRHHVGRAITPAILRSALDHPGTRDVVLLRLRAEVDGGTIRFAPLEALPFWNDNRTEPDALRLLPLREVSPALREERLSAIVRALGPAVTVTP